MKAFLRWFLVAVGLTAFGSMAVAGPFFTSLKLYFGQRNWARAAKVGPKAIEEEPNNPEAFYKYGSALAELDSLEMAGRMFQQAVDISKGLNDPDVLKEAERSRDFYFIKHWNEGIAARNDGSGLLDSLGSKIDTTQADVKAVVEHANARYWKSIEEFTKAGYLKPKDPKPWTARGSAYSLMGATAEGLACYQKALEISPTDTIAHKNIKIAYTEMARKMQEAGKWAEASALFDTLVARGDTAALLDLAVSHYENASAQKDTTAKYKSYREAATYYKQYMDAFPADTAVVRDYALALIRGHQYADAEVVIKRMVAKNPLDPELHAFMAEIYFGRNTQAVTAEFTASTALTKGADADPAKLKPAPATDAGKVMARMGRPEKVMSYQDSGYTTSVWFYTAKRELYAFLADKQIGKSTWVTQ